MAAVQAPGERVAEPSPELGAAETSWYGKEVATLAERNMALRAVLGSKEQELSRAQVTLQALQEERDRLQRKVGGTGASQLPRAHGHLWGGRQQEAGEPTVGCSGSNVSPPETALRETEARSRGDSANRSRPRSPAPLPRAVNPWEARLGPTGSTLRSPRCIEQLKGLNHLLTGTLQECKSDSERLSMLLGQHESNSTALRLAARCSEHRMEALEVLLALARAKLDARGHAPSAGESRQTGSSIPAPATGWQPEQGMPWGPCGPPSPREEEEEEEEEGVLREYLRRLQAEQAAVEVSLMELGCSGPPGPVTRPSDAIRAKVEQAVRASLAALPGERPWPKLDKTQLLQELAALQESMADVKTQLHLAEKDKRGLELGTYTLGAQEAAYLLLIEHLQWERDAGSGPPSPGSSTSEGSTGSSRAGVTAQRGQPGAAGPVHRPRRRLLPGAQVGSAAALPPPQPGVPAPPARSTLTCTSPCLGQLSGVPGRRGQLGEWSQVSGLPIPCPLAPLALVLAYRGARRKQEAQLRRLEAQTGAMGERQAQQAHALAQRIQALEEQRAAGAETCI
uniref:USH1 protein network component harmonin binding protein 1 n=1 Tax=Crocodylus porosus TaxID=8502 RepID=A0A7M4DXJ6_CROPO